MIVQLDLTHLVISSSSFAFVHMQVVFVTEHDEVRVVIAMH